MVQLISDGQKLVRLWGHFSALGVALACRVVIVSLVVVVMIFCLLIAILRWKFASLHRPVSKAARFPARKINTSIRAG